MFFYKYIRSWILPNNKLCGKVVVVEDDDEREEKATQVGNKIIVTYELNNFIAVGDDGYYLTTNCVEKLLGCNIPNILAKALISGVSVLSFMKIKAKFVVVFPIRELRITIDQ